MLFRSRAHLIWATLDKDGKRASGRQGAERKALLKAYKDGKIHPERYISQIAIIRAKLVTTLYRHREKNLSAKRLSSLHGTNRKMREQRRATAATKGHGAGAPRLLRRAALLRRTTRPTLT